MPAPAPLPAEPLAPPLRDVDTPLDHTLARAVLQRKKTKEKGWLDSLWETVDDVVETVGKKLDELRELSKYPLWETPLPKPGIEAWYASKGLSAISDGKALLSKTKVPLGDKVALELVKMTVQAWGVETYGRLLLPTSASGTFDAEAAAAVKHVQRAAGLTDDGVVGRKTLAVLEAYVLREGPELPWVDDTAADPRTLPVTVGFTADEERWIEEVWNLPPIKALFGLYPAVPPQILTRVDMIVSDKDGSVGGSQGIHREGGEQIEIADTTYKQIEGWNTTKSPEAQFKTVLIHELFHALEAWSDFPGLGGPELKTPSRLVADMIDTKFGWFIHPNADKWETELKEKDPYAEVQKECHFSWGEHLVDAKSAYRLPAYSPLLQTMLHGVWENSPDNRGAEEDVATCLGMYLGSTASHDELKTNFPRRHELIDGYVYALRAAAEARL